MNIRIPERCHVSTQSESQSGAQTSVCWEGYSVPQQLHFHGLSYYQAPSKASSSSLYEVDYFIANVQWAPYSVEWVSEVTICLTWWFGSWAYSRSLLKIKLSSTRRISYNQQIKEIRLLAASGAILWQGKQRKSTVRVLKMEGLMTSLPSTGTSH